MNAAPNANADEQASDPAADFLRGRNDGDTAGATLSTDHDTATLTDHDTTAPLLPPAPLRPPSPKGAAAGGPFARPHWRPVVRPPGAGVAGGLAAAGSTRKGSFPPGSWATTTRSGRGDVLAESDSSSGEEDSDEEGLGPMIFDDGENGPSIGGLYRDIGAASSADGVGKPEIVPGLPLTSVAGAAAARLEDEDGWMAWDGAAQERFPNLVDRARELRALFTDSGDEEAPLADASGSPPPRALVDHDVEEDAADGRTLDHGDGGAAPLPAGGGDGPTETEAVLSTYDGPTETEVGSESQI